MSSSDHLSGAVISDDKLYRYGLWRTWNPELHLILWIGLNPSTADANTDDQTIRRMRSYSQAWGFGGLLVGNLFGYRSTDPYGLNDAQDPFGPENDAYLQRMNQKASMVLCCWGTFKAAQGAGKYVQALLPERKLHCLGLSAKGSPLHPLRLPGNLTPRDYLP